MTKKFILSLSCFYFTLEEYNKTIIFIFAIPFNFITFYFAEDVKKEMLKFLTNKIKLENEIF